uniref:Uncharacterized protein n=1 Tax=Ornithorhynchus anatinus TaxID=9258 RepID=K7ED25_ORNAN
MLGKRRKRRKKRTAMSFSQFGYPYGSASQFLVPTSPSSACCESAARPAAAASSGSAPAAALCCPSYERRLLGSGRPQLGATLAVYGPPFAPAASPAYGGYLPYSAESPALCSALVSWPSSGHPHHPSPGPRKTLPPRAWARPREPRTPSLPLHRPEKGEEERKARSEGRPCQPHRRLGPLRPGGGGRGAEGAGDVLEEQGGGGGGGDPSPAPGPGLGPPPVPLSPPEPRLRAQGGRWQLPRGLGSAPRLLPLRPSPGPGPVRQVRLGGLQRLGPEEERHAGDHGHAEGLAAGAPQEPLPHQGREDHAGHHHQDDPHPGVHLVRQRAPAAEEGEQDDLGAQEQGRG